MAICRGCGNDMGCGCNLNPDGYCAACAYKVGQGLQPLYIGVKRMFKRYVKLFSL